MAEKPIPRKPEPLTAAIISYMGPGEERGDARCPARTLSVFCRTARCAKSSCANVGALTLPRPRDRAKAVKEVAAVLLRFRCRLQRDG